MTLDRSLAAGSSPAASLPIPRRKASDPDVEEIHLLGQLIRRKDGHEDEYQSVLNVVLRRMIAKELHE